MERVTFPEDLIARARAGEEEAFLEICGLARLLILRLSQSHFRLSQADFEDLFQEVIFSFYRNLSRIEYPTAWMYASCRNIASRRRSGGEQSWEEKHDALLKSHSLEDSLMIWESIWKLTPYCRHIILRLIVQGYTEVELAREMRMNDRTLHLHKKKCMKNLYRLYVGLPEKKL